MKKITYLLFLFVGVLFAQEDSYEVKNIAENTKFSDFGVSFLGDNTAVFASSRKGKKSIRNKKWSGNKQPFLELYTGTVNDSGEIENLELFSDNINSKYHESNIIFTKDNKTVYFTSNNYYEKKFRKDSLGWNNLQMYRAEVSTDGTWNNITPMPFNNDHYSVGHPVLNKDETQLYFTSDMPGSMGGTDIFVVAINEDGSYGTPRNLGPNVNTHKKEMFPFVDENDVLYFSSDGYFEGLGGLDIYAAKISGNEVRERALHLDMPLNSASDDFGIVFKNGQRTGYFSSNRVGGKGDDDIYYFKELKPLDFDCKQVVHGVVREKETGALLPGALVKLYDKNGEVVESVIADDFAAFSFKVACKDAYKVIGEKENYAKDSQEFETTDEQDLELELGLFLDRPEFVSIRGVLMVNINPIYFDLDKSFIRPDAAIEIEKVVRIMKKYPELKIDMGSHTDSRAPDDYNDALSERRAASTLEWIIGRGIDPSRISGKGYGETQLVNKCSNDVKCSEAEHQLNRRTEFVIVNPEVIR